MKDHDNSIASKFIKAVSYVAIASVITRIFGVLVTVLIARYLKSSSLGIFTIVQSVIGLFATFIGFGLGITATKMMAQYHTKDSQKASRILSLLLVAFLISLFIGTVIYCYSLQYLTNNIYSIPALLQLLKLSFFWLIITAAIQFYESILSGLQGFKNIMLVQSISGMLNLPIVLVAFSLGNFNPINALIISMTIASFLQLIILVYFTRMEAKKYSISLSFDKLGSLIKPVLLDFSLPAFIGKIFEQPMSWLSILLLVKLGNDISSVGGLTVINNIRTWVLYFPTMVSYVMVPIFTDVYHTRSNESFEKTLVLNQRFLWLTSLPILVLLIVFIRPFLAFAFGVNYEFCWKAGAIMLASTVLIPINEVNDKAMISMGKMWLSIFFRLIYMILFLFSLFIFIPKYDLLGYVISFGLSYFIYVFIQTLWLRKITKDQSVFTLTILSFLSLAFAVFLAKNSSLSVIFSLGTVLFFAILLIEWFWIIKVEEKLLLSSQIKNIVNNLSIKLLKGDGMYND